MEMKEILKLILGCYKVSRNEQNLKNVVSTAIVMKQTGHTEEMLRILRDDVEITADDLLAMQQILNSRLEDLNEML